MLVNNKKYRLKINGETYPPFGIDREFANELSKAFQEQNKNVIIEQI